MSWEQVASKNIFGRRHSDLLEEWSLTFSDAVHEEAHLQDALAEIWTEDLPSTEKGCEYRSVAGANTNAMSELIRLKLKADAAWSCTVSLHDGGQVSWSNVDAHHCSILYARYLIGLCGVFCVELGGSWFLIDVFPYFRRNSSKQKMAYKAATKNIDHPVAIIANGTAKIDQRHIWQLLQRMMRVLNQDALDHQFSRWVQHFRFKDFRAVRNKIFYIGGFWPDREDLVAPVLPESKLEDIELISDFHENIWVNSDDRDRVLMQIMRKVSDTLSPEYLRQGQLQRSLAA